MKLFFLKQSSVFHDTHEKPWGGVYARRLWKKMLIASLLLVLLSAAFHYKIYEQYTRPVAVSADSLSRQVVNLDQAGLAKAVSDIKEKEVKFNRYLVQKVEITDPAK